MNGLRGQPIPMAGTGNPPAPASFRSDDLDEVREYMDRHNGAHWRCAQGRGPLGFELSVVPGRQAKLGWVSQKLGQVVRGRATSWTLHLVLAGEYSYRHGRRVARACAGEAQLLSPFRDVTVKMTPGSIVSAIVDADALADEFAARRPGQSGRWSLRERHLPLSGAESGALLAALKAFSSSMPKVSAEAARDHEESRLIAGIADLLERTASPDFPRAASIERMLFVEEWIDAHLHEPITLGTLCRVAGVGARSLQLAFASRRNATPMEFVAERRMASAHRMLRLPEMESTTVTQVATTVGLTHLGRFAAQYRQIFGEPPSLTRRRALGLHGRERSASQSG